MKNQDQKNDLNAELSEKNSEAVKVVDALMGSFLLHHFSLRYQRSPRPRFCKLQLHGGTQYPPPPLPASLRPREVLLLSDGAVEEKTCQHLLAYWLIATTPRATEITEPLLVAPGSASPQSQLLSRDTAVSCRVGWGGGGVEGWWGSGGVVEEWWVRWKGDGG